LIFNLKRFEYDFSTDRKLKVNDKFSFPLRLNIKPWTQEGLQTDSTENPIPDQPDWYYEYELVGILVHSGNADSGHYYSYIRCKADEDQPKWFEFNDSRVVPYNINSMEKDCFGGSQEMDTWDSKAQKHIKKIKDIERSAYMLFYQRVQPDSVSYWGDDSDVSAELKEEEKNKLQKERENAIKQVQELQLQYPKLFSNGVPQHLYEVLYCNQPLSKID